MEWEVSIIEWMQQNLGSVSAFLGKVFAFVGSEIGLLLLLVIVLFCWKKEVGKRLAVLMVMVNTYLPMIKSLVLRPRPYMTYPDRVEARVLVDKAAAATDVASQGYSFPSMHSASVTASYLSLAREVKKRWLWIVSVLLVLLVGISRMAVGMHYPTDVLAGWGLGLVMMGFLTLMERYIHTEWLRHLILVLLALPGVIYIRTQDYFTALGLFIGVAVGLWYEDRYVHFEDTRNPFAMILRPLGAFAIYFVVNTLLKMPFSKEFLEMAELGPLLVRTLRYAIIIFVILGLYPKVFPLFEKIGKKKEA